MPTSKIGQQGGKAEKEGKGGKVRKGKGTSEREGKGKEGKRREA